MYLPASESATPTKAIRSCTGASMPAQRGVAGVSQRSLPRQSPPDGTCCAVPPPLGICRTIPGQQARRAAEEQTGKSRTASWRTHRRGVEMAPPCPALLPPAVPPMLDDPDPPPLSARKGRSLHLGRRSGLLMASRPSCAAPFPVNFFKEQNSLTYEMY